MQKIAASIGRDEFDVELQSEYVRLTDYVNTKMWDEDSRFYYDVTILIFRFITFFDFTIVKQGPSK